MLMKTQLRKSTTAGKQRLSASMPMFSTTAAILILSAMQPLPLPAIETKPDHCHTAACTPWSSVAINVLDPAKEQHQHRDGANLLTGVADEFKPFAVWDDNNYRYDAVVDDSLPNYGHGFMQKPATFRFHASVPVSAQALIRTKVRDAYETSLNRTGLRNTGGVTIKTKIQFTEVLAGEDFLIQFAPTFPVGKNQGGGPGGVPGKSFPVATNEISGDGSWPGAPGRQGPAQGGRNGVLAWWSPSAKTLTFNSNIPDAAWYKDDTGNAADDTNPNIQGDKFDFVTVALHEWGHVIGLDHPDEATANALVGTVMDGRAQPRRAGNAGVPGIVRTFDLGTLRGGKDLYTIAVPEPRLSIEQILDTIRIYWSSLVEGFTLEGAANLTGPIPWTSVTNSVVGTNGVYSVTVPIGNQNFFRLKLD
jgi:hypothetical protein